jgi:1-phosphatidylinositol phosphodiesterase
MHKRCFKIILVLALMSLVLGSSVIPVLGHNYGRGGYDYDQIIENEKPDWMASLPDSMRISELSIPGTHDTMAWCEDESNCNWDWYDPKIGTWFVRCQAFRLDKQLLIGIRALDIRCRHIEDEFAIHHGPIHLDDMWFDVHVLLPVVKFLTDHPTETVLMRIQSADEPTGNTRTFSDTFEEEWGQVFHFDIMD